MNRVLPAGTPHTDGALFDYLHQWWGIGDYDEDTHGPWWKWRRNQVARVKASRTKREASLAELYIAALYCRATNQRVEGVTWLYRHIAAGWRWWEGQPVHDPTLTAYADAVRIESANPDPTWLHRLMRADPAHRQALLDQWEVQRWTA